ncbi:reverse transcriptase domain-containing protein [Tanacetum coccineum]|uniref:Reverse transcriptase domain-containing protein n=1 Tax=Tanacetum coccineum TaxID=301880 RepID=A0ABQ5J4Z2_9ASTR
MPCTPRKVYEEAIVLPEINADHFEIKTNLLQLVQASPFHGYERENPHAHINSFKRITSTLRFRDVPNDVIKLMMFPYSLEGAAKVWYEKEPPNSILTWEDLVTKFVNQFFPPSKTTHLKNEISHFTQKFDETFSEAWERFKEMLRACPHHGFTELTQVDTFYNGLNENDQDSLNAAAGGNLLSKTTREALNIIENKSKVRYSRNKSNVSRMNTTSRESVSKTDERIDKLADQLSTLVEIVSKKVVTPAPVKAVEEICVTCSGPHAWYNCPNTDNNQSSVCAATGTYNQVNPPNRVSNQMAPPGFAPVQNNGQNRYNQNQGQGNNFNRGNNFHGNQGFQVQNNHAPNFQNQGFQNQPFQVPNNQVQQEFSNEFSSYKRTNDQMMRNMQNQINSLKGEWILKTSLNFVLFRVIPIQPKGRDEAITTRSGVAYEGPSIPTNPSPKKVVERETEETTDKEQTNFQGSTAHIPPPVNPIPIPEPDVPKTLPKPNIPYPSRLDNQKLREKASYQMEKIFQIFQDLRFDISFADALLLMPRFAPTIRNLLMNKEKLLELAKIPLNENCSAMLLKKLPEKLGDPDKFLIPCNFPGMDVCHALADLGASINLMPLSIWKKLSLPELTPTRMTLELADRSITRPKGVAEDVFVKVGSFHFPTDFVVVDFEADPRVPLILGRSFLRTSRALIDVYEGELILRNGDERLIFHVDKHPKKHANESIKMINFIDVSCEDSFGEVLRLKKSNHFLSGSTTPLSDSSPSLTSFETSDSLLEEFADELALLDPFPPGNKDVDVKAELREIELLLNRDPSTNFSPMITIDPNPKKFTDEPALACLPPPGDDESFLKEDVQKENFQVYSNPLFEFDDNYNSSNINPLFKEMLEDVESKDSNVSNFDEPVLLNTPLFDEDECFDPGGNVDEIDAFLAIEVSTKIEEGYYDSDGDVFYLERLLIDDTTHNLFFEVLFDHEPQCFKDESELDTLKNMVKVFDPGIWEKTFSPSCVTDISKMDKNRAKKDKTKHDIGRAPRWQSQAIPLAVDAWRQSKGSYDGLKKIPSGESKVSTLHTAFQDFKKKAEAQQEEQAQVFYNRVAELEAYVMDVSGRLEGEFYPAYLTTLGGRRWFLTHGIQLAVLKCIKSLEYQGILGHALGRAVDFSMQEGLEAGYEHGVAGTPLSAVEAYNSEAARTSYFDAVGALEDVDFPLVNLLKSKKDVGIDGVIDCFFLDGPLADLPEAAHLQPCLEQLSVPIHHSDDKAIVGETSLSFALL